MSAMFRISGDHDPDPRIKIVMWRDVVIGIAVKTQPNKILFRNAAPRDLFRLGKRIDPPVELASNQLLKANTTSAGTEGS